MENSVRPQNREFLGQPAGLWVLCTTEMWERFCYYGMRAFLVLYLVATLNSENPGFSWSEAGAYKLYGWFTGLVYLTPLLGGWVADRFIGTHKSVLLGGILIALGEFALFFTEYFRAGAMETITFAANPIPFSMFFVGLGLLVLGNGFFKPCISVMVGQLYGDNDTRRDIAFTYFYMGINIGAFLAPFVAGTIAEKIGWHWGFLVAGIGMIFGLCTYSLLRPKYLGRIGFFERPSAGEPVGEPSGSLGAQNGTDTGAAHRGPLSRVDTDRIGVILVLSFFCIAFWSVFEQAGSSLNTFAKKLTDRRVSAEWAQWMSGTFLVNEDLTEEEIATAEHRSGGDSFVPPPVTGDPVYTFPATWYQSVNPLGIVLFGPLFAWLWSVLARRRCEPSTPVKFAFGLALLGIAFLFMVGGAIQAQKTNGNAAASWLLMTYTFCTFGELCLSPVGLSMVSRLAPKRYASQLMGVWFIASAVAGYLSGYLAAILGSSSDEGARLNFFFGTEHGLADYFFLMAIIPLVAAGIVFVLGPKLRRMMHENLLQSPTASNGSAPNSTAASVGRGRRDG